MDYNRKQKNTTITPELIDCRVKRAMSSGFSKQKWIEFCETLMSRGFRLELYEAWQTFSKYITVSKLGSRKRPFKVRFSNHKPIKKRELNKDCDFFVGITHLGFSTTQDALQAVEEHFR